VSEQYRRARGRALLSSLLIALALESTALGSDALNSSVKPKNVGSSDEGPHDEFNLLPVAGGTTDIGIGGGYFAGLARVEQGYDPYIWNLESAGLVTFKLLGEGKVVLPYQDDYIQLTVPRLFGIPLRLEVRSEYSWETTLGSTASVTPLRHRPRRRRRTTNMVGSIRRSSSMFAGGWSTISLPWQDSDFRKAGFRSDKTPSWKQICKRAVPK